MISPIILKGMGVGKLLITEGYGRSSVIQRIMENLYFTGKAIVTLFYRGTYK